MALKPTNPLLRGTRQNLSYRDQMSLHKHLHASCLMAWWCAVVIFMGYLFWARRWLHMNHYTQTGTGGNDRPAQPRYLTRGACPRHIVASHESIHSVKTGGFHVEILSAGGTSAQKGTSAQNDAEGSLLWADLCARANNFYMELTHFYAINQLMGRNYVPRTRVP